MGNHQDRKKKSRLLISLLLMGMTLLVYTQVVHFQFVNFDDGGYVLNNLSVQVPLSLKSIFWALTTTQAANWHPLTWVSYLLDYQLYGLNPGGYHLTNLLFHLANAVLLFLLLEKMTQGFWQSALVAALFAIHPLHVESVAWIAERKDVLSAFFWILTLGTYASYVERPGIYRYLLVLLTFVLGLMSKPMVVTLPFVLFLIDYWPLKRFVIQIPWKKGDRPIGNSIRSENQGASFQTLLAEKIPLFLLSAASAFMTYFAQQSAGAVNQLIPWTTRCLNALVAYAVYLGKMFCPLHLSMFYPYQAVLPIWQTLGAGLILGLISFGVLWKWKRYPYLIIGWLWYLGTLVPVIGLVQVGSQSMADRYTYIPLIGLFVMMAWGTPDLLARWPGRKIFSGFTAGVILMSLSILSWVQVAYWQNSLTLFHHALNVSIRNYKAHDMLGFTLMDEGKLDEAIVHFREAIRLKPQYGSAYNNLGVALEKQGKIGPARVQYLEAIRVQPGCSEAYYNLGNIMSYQGNLEMAATYFREALKINKQYAEAYNNLGVVLLGQGRIEEAIRHNSKALTIKPFYADAHYNLANALVCAGKIDEALRHFQEALRIKPDYDKALNNLKLVQNNRNRLNDVIVSFQRASIIRPSFRPTPKESFTLPQKAEKER
jgi:protein O-mannosyl-transferase